MAMAHVCLGCGWDLARVRPAREPRYGLNLVRCPRCEAVFARRRHPVQRGWRTARRVFFTCLNLLVRIALVALFCALTTFAMVEVYATTIQQRFNSPDELMELCIWVFAVLAPMKGAWLTAAFEHRRLIDVWAGWFLFMLLPPLVIVIISLIVREFPPELVAAINKDESTMRLFATGLLMIVLPCATVLALMMLCALAGIPIGKLLLQLDRWRRSAMFRLGRKQLRMSRSN